MTEVNFLEKTNRRIDVADVLRGLSVAAILLLHAIEHFNFYSFPKADSLWLIFADTVVWDSLFFMIGGKAYAVFALLFGFGFYIQYGNAQSQGIDFRPRFMWRLFLLFLLGQVNAAFFTGEVLVLFALMGFVLPLFARSSNKLVLVFVVIFMLQPIELYKIVAAFFSPESTPATSLYADLYPAIRHMHNHGDFMETVRVNLWEGQLFSLLWAFQNARIFQVAAIFLLGMLVGRMLLFVDTAQNRKTWLTILVVALFAYFSLNGLNAMLKDFVIQPVILKSSAVILSSLAKFSFMCVLVSFVLLLYYTYPQFREKLNVMIPYGKMSLTNYITQSVVGGYLFYNWGLKLSLGAFYSVLVGVVMLLLQVYFCKWWLKKYHQGPFEYVWKKATWINSGRTVGANRK